MKPICVPCKRFYRIKKTGYFFVEGMPKPGAEHPLPGTEEPHNWVPYKLWCGDLWECPDCGAQTISGVGAHPVAEHYQPYFAEKVSRYSSGQQVKLLQVNDC